MWRHRPVLEALEDRTVLDNTLGTAQNLGVLQGRQLVRDQLTATDALDYYQFRLDATANLSVQLGGLAGARLALSRAGGDTLARSASGQLQLSALPAGDYFLGVASLPRSPLTGAYTLSATADLARRAAAMARDLGEPNGQVSYADFIGGADRVDTYRFRLSQATTVLAELSDDAVLQLFQDANFNGRLDDGELLASAETRQLERVLPAGTYYYRVLGGDAGVNYHLTLTTDAVGNTLVEATDLGTVTVEHVSYFESVGGSDDSDVYGITLPDGGTLHALLNGLAANADVQVIQDVNGNGALDDGELLTASTNAGTLEDKATIDLAAGSYFIRVVGVEGATNYTLTVWWRVQDLAGNTVNTAHDAGSYPAARDFADFVGSSDTVDVYRFVRQEPGGPFTALLTMNTSGSLDANADLELSRLSFNNLEVLATSSVAGVGDDQINFSNLNPGTYFLRVVRVSGEVNYNLRLTTDLGGSSPDGAYDLGILSTTRTLKGNLLQGTTDVNNVDYYRFTLPTAARVKSTLNQAVGALTLDEISSLTGTSTREIVNLSNVAGFAPLDLPAGTYQLKLGDSDPIAYTLTLERDFASFGGAAADLGTLSASALPSVAEKAPNQGTDPVDFYRFRRLSNGVAATVGLVGLSANADLFLYYDANGNSAIDSGELLASQTNAGTRSEFLGLREEAPDGNYFVGVRKAPGTAYTLQVANNYRNPALDKALDPGASFETRTFRGSVGAGRREEWYRLTLPVPTVFTAELRGLRANVDLQFIVDFNGNGTIDPTEVRGLSSNPGTSSERISTLLAGTAYLRVLPIQGETTYELVLGLDAGGNTLANANALPSFFAPFEFGRIDVNDFVSTQDPNDFYSVNLPLGGTLRADLTGLSADANLELILDANNNRVIDAGDVLASSSLTGAQAETIQRNLSAGRYFVRVFRASGDTSYQLRLELDAVGNTLGTALNYGTLTGFRGQSDAINNGSDQDFYRFDLAAPGTVTVNLTGAYLGRTTNGVPPLTGNLDLQLIRDANNNGIVDGGEVVSGVASPGTANERVKVPLAAGSYFIRVFAPTAPSSPVAYSIAAAVDRAGETPGAARDLGALAGQQTVNDHVGRDDLDDYYRFSVATTRTVTATVAGTSGILGFLSADADLRLYRDANNNGIAEDSEVLAASVTAGVAGERISLQLSAGTYFLRVDAFKTQTSSVFFDTSYLLTLS